MTAGTLSGSSEEDDNQLPSQLDHETGQFIDQFVEAWEVMNGRRTPGRVLALLMISDEPYMSAQRIGALLHASTGAVSMATRDLADVGYITRHREPGVRRKFYRVEDDVWGTFLGGERDYLRRMAAVLDEGLQTRAGSRPRPATRLRNGSVYMKWLEQHHRRLLEQWRHHRDQQLGS